MTLRIIHVGVGNRGYWPIDIVRDDSRFKIVGIVEINPLFAKHACSVLNLPDRCVFRTLAEALRGVDADAVIICTPSTTHAELCRLAFAHGKHVLVEKCMTNSYTQARTLVDDADRAGVKFCVVQNYRYHPHVRTITRLLTDSTDSHYPGRVHMVEFIQHRYRPEPRTLTYPYAMIWDMSCHHMDLLSMWLGSASSVTAITYSAPWSNYTHAANVSAIIEYESGAVCQYTLTHAAVVTRQHVLLQGDRGALLATDGPEVQFFPRPSTHLGNSAGERIDGPSGEPAEKGVMADFQAYIRHDVEPGISGRNNLATLAACEMLIRSAMERRAITRESLRTSVELPSAELQMI